MIRKNMLWRIRFPFWASSEVLHLQRTRERRACDLQTSGKEDYPIHILRLAIETPMIVTRKICELDWRDCDLFTLNVRLGLM